MQGTAGPLAPLGRSRVSGGTRSHHWAGLGTTGPLSGPRSLALACTTGPLSGPLSRAGPHSHGVLPTGNPSH